MKKDLLTGIGNGILLIVVFFLLGYLIEPVLSVSSDIRVVIGIIIIPALILSAEFLITKSNKKRPHLLFYAVSYIIFLALLIIMIALSVRHFV
ncbi:MAG: hypothetical protein HY514_01415 [Candidatus Aenigmarchaeota archaeon]|nr:hypothetical protein [Candidatus Aenigmarchaeota archaeon]